MLPYQDGWRYSPVEAPPGEYGYQIIARGQSILDRYNPLTTFRGEREVSLLSVPDCSVPELRVDAVETAQDGRATLRASFFTASGRAPLDASSVSIKKEAGGAPAASVDADPDTGAITISLSSLDRGKHTVIIEAADAEGRRASVRAAVWMRPAMEDWNGGLLYHLMIDRFRGDGGAALAPPKTPGSRAGGTLDGVRAEIEAGSFDEMGVSALWLSPVYTNPEGMHAGRDGHEYESYHGYWPLESRGVDARLGGEAALHAVIDAAHRHGIRVIFDLVPNHVYIANERYQSHERDGWFNDGPDSCVCGSPGCGWGDHIQTCWFTDYLPDVRWQNPASTRAAVDDARYWMDTFDADGVRIDAVPMMPRAATRRMLHEIRQSVAPRSAMFAVGEVFTGPGIAGIDEIRYHLGPDGLDGAFDFPLLWATRDVIGADRAGFDSIETTLQLTERSYAGSGVVLGRMVDNHDTSRFISEATGGAYADPYTNPAPTPQGALPYARQRMALAFILTLPGMPVLYYGDEIGLPGGGDPDSRRVMPALDSISAEQLGVREVVKRLGQLRRCSKALQVGERVPLAATTNTYAYVRDAGDGLPVLVFFSKAKVAGSIPVSEGVVAPGEYIDWMTGETFSLAGSAAVPIEPLSFRVLTPKDNPCPRPAW